MKIIPVTCALIIHQEKVLATQRSPMMSHPGKWEFPGGKVEDGESAEECLKREIAEEISIQIDIREDLPSFDHAYVPEKTIRLLPFIAGWKEGDIRLSEHAEIEWLGKDLLFSLDWAEADIPVVHYLYDNWSKLVSSKNAEADG